MGGVQKNKPKSGDREFSCDVTDHELADARHFGGPRSKKKWSTALLLAVLTNPVAI